MAMVGATPAIRRMTTYQTLLPLRPTSVVHQLGGESTVPLLNGRLILDALNAAGRVAWAPRLQPGPALVALFNAAIHQQAALGLVLGADRAAPGELKVACPPGPFVRAVVVAAEQSGSVPPFFLHVQEPPVVEPRGEEFEAVRAHLGSCLEAGFTSFGVDLSRCSPRDRAALAGELLAPVLDLELGIAVRLPASGGGQDWASGIGATILELGREGISPDLVVLPGPLELGEAAVDLARGVVPLIAPSLVAWENTSRDFFRTLNAESPVKVLLSHPALERIGAERQPPANPETLEALVYMEALEWMEVLRVKGSAGLLLSALEPA